MKDNIVQKKSYEFALEIIKTYQFLSKEKREYVLAKQLLRCGTSICANIEEAIGGSTQKDFLYRITVSYKEARETRYWLKLLRDSLIIKENIAKTLLNNCEEIIKILGSIQITMKNKNA